VREGPANELKLIDFGMATPTRIIAGPSPIGSPVYIAPETRGPGSHDLFAADVFALGVTLYVMVIGAMPWSMTTDGCAHFRAFRRHAESYRRGDAYNESAVRRFSAFCERGRGTDVSSELSRQLVQLLDACLRLEPQGRPTAAQILECPWLNPGDDEEDDNWGPVYRSLADDDDERYWAEADPCSDDEDEVGELVIEGADAMPSLPMPSRQAAFKGGHWE